MASAATGKVGRTEIGEKGCWIYWIPELSSPSSPHGGSHNLTNNKIGWP